MIKIRTKSTPILKSGQFRADDDKQLLMLSIRVYRNDEILDRFNYYVNDYGTPVYLHRNEIKEGLVVDHSMSIRYNELVRFLKKKIEEVVTDELTTKSILNRDVVKDRLNNAINVEFNVAFIAKINTQNITFPGSGFNGVDEIEVDRRAVEAFNKIRIETEPTIDPLGQVELNDLDGGDYENLIISQDVSIRLEAERLRIASMTTEKRYQLGEYDKTNIFQLFGSIYYNPALSSTYDKIVVRLFEYKYFKKPNENANSFNEQWVTNFMTFLWAHGYTHLNSVNFDPLNFDPNIFIGKAIRKYKPDNLYKLLEIMQTVSNTFADQGLFARLDFGRIELSKICGVAKREEGSRLEHNLDNHEFNKLFFYKFEPKRLKEYQKLFDGKKTSKGDDKTRFKQLPITIKDLEIARDLFCLQVMSGGLRGYKDLMTLEFNGDHQVSFYVKKLKGYMINPLNVYTEIIAKTFGTKLPEYSFSYSANSMETINRALCQTIAEIIPFDRMVIYENQRKRIKDLFNPYFARKTFAQIMYDEYDLTEEEISIFTGHSTSRKKSILTIHYLNVKSHTKKRKLFAKIKLPKGQSKTTSRSCK